MRHSDRVTAGFPKGRQPEFPMGKIPLGQYSCKKCFKKSVTIAVDVVVTLKVIGVPCNAMFIQRVHSAVANGFTQDWGWRGTVKQ